MDKAIILRYAEIHLKGNNRGYFENTLIENIKKALKDFRYEFQKTHGRYVISGFHENDETYIVSSLEKVLEFTRSAYVMLLTVILTILRTRRQNSALLPGRLRSSATAPTKLFR